MKKDELTKEWLSQWLFKIKDISTTHYTKPTVYVPVSLRNKHGSYKPKPDEKIRINWQHFHPEKKKRIQVRKSNGIKTFKTLAEQKKFAKALCNAYELMLSRGYSPFEETKAAIVSKNIMDELQKALDVKEYSVNIKTFRPYKHALKKFVTWLKTTNYSFVLANTAELGFIVDSFFLHLKKNKTNATSYNNIRSGLSALFATMVKSRVILNNPVLAVDTMKADPKNNKPFTREEIIENGKWLRENDPALHFYIKVISYSFLRTEEAMKIKIGDIDLKRNVIKVFTKKQETEPVPIIKQLRELFVNEKITSYPADYSLIHPSGKPNIWLIKPEQKLKHYRPRFNKLKKAMGYDNEYKIYSYRHSIAQVVFKSYENENLTHDEVLLKMKAVTRHKSVAGLKNYLRGIGAYVAKDYSKRIDIDL